MKPVSCFPRNEQLGFFSNRRLTLGQSRKKEMKMSEHPQMGIGKGNEVVRLHSGWGIPRNALSSLRKAASLPSAITAVIAKGGVL